MVFKVKIIWIVTQYQYPKKKVLSIRIIAQKKDRYPIAKTMDSNILHRDVSFIGKTQKIADYMGQKGEGCKVKV